MSIKELENELQIQVGEYNEYIWGKSLSVEYEKDGVEKRFEFAYNFKKRRFECFITLYDAANDNNCENQEGNTTEEIEFSNDIESLVNYVSDMYAIELKDKFLEELSKGDLE